MTIFYNHKMVVRLEKTPPLELSSIWTSKNAHSPEKKWGLYFRIHHLLTMMLSGLGSELVKHGFPTALCES